MAGRVPCRPALLRTCSAASGSRCGSSSGTVNWIFRGLLSGSMAGRRPLASAAAGGKVADSGLGRVRSLSAPLLSGPGHGPGPSPARSAPGSRLRAPSSRPRGLWGRLLALHPPLTAPLPPPAPSLNPVVAAPLAAGVPTPRAGERGVAGPSRGGQPSWVCRCPWSSGQGGGGGSYQELLQTGQVLGVGKVEGHLERGGGKHERKISFPFMEKGCCLIQKRRKGDLVMQQEGLRLDMERDFP